MSITINNHYFFPAEWHKQSGIMLTWPHSQTDWKPYLQDITNTYIELTRHIARHEYVLIATPDVQMVKRILKNSLSDTEFKNILCYEVASNDTWARDHGPLTLISNGPSKDINIQQRLLNFRFNAWGEKFAFEKDNAINEKLYDEGAFHAIMENHTDFVLEGGSIETDGHGTIFTTTSCLLAPHRNQPLSKEDISKHLCTFFHAKRVIWLEHGNLIGDDTDGHIDTIVRVAPNDTLLYVGAGNPSDSQYEDFTALRKQLETEKTIDGNPFHILELPMPDAMYDNDNKRLPATYANFVIINDAVIVPTYNQPENDEKAKATIQQAFPNYEIIGVDARTVILQHGSLHCITMQLPVGVITELNSNI